MSNPIISAEGLGKAYQLGLKIDKNQTFRDAIMNTLSSPMKRLRRAWANQRTPQIRFGRSRIFRSMSIRVR